MHVILQCNIFHIATRYAILSQLQVARVVIAVALEIDESKQDYFKIWCVAAKLIGLKRSR